MPYSEKQRKAAGADLRRVRSGKKPRTFKSMSESQLSDYASKPVKKGKKGKKK